MNKPTTFAAALAIVFATFVMPVTPGAGGLSSAQAAVSVAYSLEQLVDQSEQAVIADVQSQKSHWEDVAGSKRIVTYSKLVITETVFTRTPAKSRQKKTAQTLWVRTLGGNVGKIGQQVSGEATLERGASQLIFLTRSTSGIGLVTGMAQGHYVVDTKRTVTKNGSKATVSSRLRPSRTMGTILPRRDSAKPAYQRLAGQALSSAIATIRAMKRSRDAQKSRK